MGKMGWSESGGEGCVKHPNMNQSAGVCSCCLRERLSQLCASNNMKTAMGAYYYSNNEKSNSFSSLSRSPSSICDETSSASRRRRHHHRRNVSEVMGSFSFMLSVGSGLKKSRSIAFVAKPHDFGEVKSGKSKLAGFWSKLLRTKGKRNRDQAFMHSNTLRERTGMEL